MKAAFVGFDSAWTDNPLAPGAICSICYDGERFDEFREPELVGFKQALEFIKTVDTAGHPTMVAIDQPTIVRNPNGMRPVERVAASAVSSLGVGVQPANRGKIGMFDDGAPIWQFLQSLNATDDPERSRTAASGLYLLEVFPALALPSINKKFCGRRLAPHYNPVRRKTFRQQDWYNVVDIVASEAKMLDCDEFFAWCNALKKIIRPRKADQDKLDAAICLLISIRWKFAERKDLVMIGDLEDGYMIAPVSVEIKRRLEMKAITMRVAVDGNIPKTLPKA